VQTDVLDRIFEVLEVSPKIVDRAAPDEARKQARLEQQRSWTSNAPAFAFWRLILQDDVRMLRA
jgi:hypothetical protein